jgi:hypothetical protein
MGSFAWKVFFALNFPPEPVPVSAHLLFGFGVFVGFGLLVGVEVGVGVGANVGVGVGGGYAGVGAWAVDGCSSANDAATTRRNPSIATPKRPDFGTDPLQLPLPAPSIAHLATFREVVPGGGTAPTIC